MMRSFCILALITVVCFCMPPAPAQSAKTVNRTLRGWLSDEQCARGRASSGVYTGTNPECAKECVAKGKKIVFIDAVRKTVVAIDNQSAAKQNIGDYVEVAGVFNAGSLHINSLKQLEKGVAQCERTKLER
jgi:hypothetical protein